MNAMPEATASLRATPALRARIEATIERLVALLDVIDGDPDLEDDGRELEDESDEDGGDTEWSGDELDYSRTESCSQGAEGLARLAAAARVHAAIVSRAVSAPTT